MIKFNFAQNILNLKCLKSTLKFKLLVNFKLSGCQLKAMNVHANSNKRIKVSRLDQHLLRAQKSESTKKTLNLAWF